MLNKILIFIISLAIIATPGCVKRKKKQALRELHQKRIALQRPFKNKKIEKLTFEEALQVYDYYKRNKKDYQLILVIERIMALSSDHAVIEPLLRQSSDLNFEWGNYEKAEESYASYAQLYPGSSDIDYIQKQQIEASFKQQSIAQRDQTKTKQTIQLAQNFLTNFPQTNARTDTSGP